MKFIIYSKTNCSYCVRAKTLLNNKGLEYHEQILGEDYTKEDLISWFPNARTVPQIEVLQDGKLTYVGGFDDLQKFLERELNAGTPQS